MTVKTQLDLFGDHVPYQCRKCSKCFDTMKESSRHHALYHRHNQRKTISVNFTLENYCLVATKEIIQCQH